MRAAGERGNPHLYQALGVLAAETGFTDEARRWFSEGTRRLPGARSSALWHAWAEMEVRSACLPATILIKKQCGFVDFVQATGHCLFFNNTVLLCPRVGQLFRR